MTELELQHVANNVQKFFLYKNMTNGLYTIEKEGLYGLADGNDYEIVECVYDKIKPLKSGKYIVIKNKMAGILSNDGKILFHPQERRIHCIEEIDVFQYKVKERRLYFTFVNNETFYITVDKIKYDKKLQIINVWKDDELKIYDDHFVQIQTGCEQIKATDLRQGKSRFYFGERNGMWGVFRIKRLQKHEPELIVKIEAVYDNSGEALLALKSSMHKNARRHKNPEYANTIVDSSI